MSSLQCECSSFSPSVRVTSLLVYYTSLVWLCRVFVLVLGAVCGWSQLSFQGWVFPRVLDCTQQISMCKSFILEICLTFWVIGLHQIYLELLNYQSNYANFASERFVSS